MNSEKWWPIIPVVNMPPRRRKIKDCENRLAAHELHISEYYYKARSYRAALNRLLPIITTYPDFPRLDAVYFYIADSYFKIKNMTRACLISPS